MPYRPGDNYVICDLSGHKIYMSDSVKTWDGLRVDKRYWYPRHPQLDVRAIPERSMAVIDGRPEQPDVFVGSQYGYGAFCLRSPGGILYVCYVLADGSLLVRQGILGAPADHINIQGGQLTVDDDGALHVEVLANPGYGPWSIATADDLYAFILTVDSDGALLVTAV